MGQCLALVSFECFLSIIHIASMGRAELGFDVDLAITADLLQQSWMAPDPDQQICLSGKLAAKRFVACDCMVSPLDHAASEPNSPWSSISQRIAFQMVRVL